eukprot:scaffold14557_cov39-Phaeocystis_antarctica.AAC.1
MSSQLSSSDLALRARASPIIPNGSCRTVSRGYVGFTISAYGMQADTVGGGTAAGAASRRHFYEKTEGTSR